VARKPSSLRTILLPLDGSQFAERALPLATAVARRSGGNLRLALVHRLPAPPATRDAVRVYAAMENAVRKAEHAYLRGIATRAAETLGRPVRSVLLEGPIARALQDYGHEIGADLVVMTTHGRGPVQRAWLGSVADRLLRSLEVPLLLVPPPSPGRETTEGEPTIERVLVPLDGSPRAEAALAPAVAVARLFNAELQLVQVVAPVVVVTEPPSLPTGLDQELTAIRKGAAQDYLDDLAGRLRTEGVPASAMAVLGGGAAVTLLELTRPGQIDLVAIATHGRSGVRRLVLGSVADKLVRAAESPVLVCRPPSTARGKRGGAKKSA
jgi:nucleotide-binding universal stress UspA family protein